MRWMNAFLRSVVQLAPALGAHHHILGLQQPPHHVQHSGPPNVGALLVRGQRGVAHHQEVETRGRDQRRDQTDQVVVHVAWVAQGGGGHGHDGGHQLIDLGEGGGGAVQSVCGNPVFLLRAVLSRTTTQSGDWVSLFRVRIEL